MLLKANKKKREARVCLSFLTGNNIFHNEETDKQLRKPVRCVCIMASDR